MASGVAVDDKCVIAFKSLVKDRKYRATMFKINDDLSEVLLDKTLAPDGGSPESGWQEIEKYAPSDDCRYIVYDFPFNHQGTIKTRVLFILWSPEGSKVRSKMIYAASQEGVVNKLEGVQRQLQITDEDDLAYGEIAKQLIAHTAGY